MPSPRGGHSPASLLALFSLSTAKTHLFLDRESGVAMMFDLDLPGLKKRLPRGMKANDITLFCTGTFQAPLKKKKAKGQTGT